jgi:hypothetical protein
MTDVGRGVTKDRCTIFYISFAQCSTVYVGLAQACPNYHASRINMISVYVLANNNIAYQVEVLGPDYLLPELLHSSLVERYDVFWEVEL